MLDVYNSKSDRHIKYRIVIPEADDKLRERCQKAAESQYGIPLPDAVSERLDKELSAIKANGHASQYLIGAMIAEQSMADGFPVTTRGMVGSALVTYLCRVTTVNPLPAHYWCPNCHHFELFGGGNYKTMGYDLQDKPCSECGKILNAEGTDIEPEVLMGINLDREPDIILNVAAEIRPKLVSFLKETFGKTHVFRAGIKATLKDGGIRRNVHPGGIFIIPEGTDITDVTDIRDEIPKDDFELPVTECDYHEIDGILKKYDLLALPELSMLAELERNTGFPAESIKTNDAGVLEMILQEGLSFLPGKIKKQKVVGSLEDSMIHELNPSCFSDLVRIIGMTHGVNVWQDNAELLIRNGHKLSDCITTRDDIMQGLLAAGMDRTKAYEIMNHVRKGRGLTKEMKSDMISVGIGDWFIKSCNKIEYLFPKAHVVEYTLLYWKMAYYRLHFPKEYTKALISVQKNV